MEAPDFTEMQIASILQQADAGVSMNDTCRQAGSISLPSYFEEKSGYGGGL